MPGRFSSKLSALERAQKQLHGQRLSIPQGSLGGHTYHSRAEDVDRQKEDGDLSDYLNKLGRKVSQASGKKTAPSRSDSLSDISISSDDDKDREEPTNLLGSRFVKKSQSQTLVDSRSLRRKDEALTSGTTLKKSATMPSFLNKSAPVYVSAALQRATQLGAKFAKRKQRANKLNGSDSEPDLSMSDNSGDYRTLKPKVNSSGLEKEPITSKSKKPSSVSYHGYDEDDVDELSSDATKFLKKSAKRSFYVGESDDDISSIGGDGNRFLKKSVSSKQSLAVDSEKESGNRFLKNSDKPPAQNKTFIKSETKKKHDKIQQKQSLQESTFLTSTPKKETEAKAGGPTLLRTLPTGSKFALDSDEEDLQEFIMNMSSASSPEIPLVREQKPPPKADNLKESWQPRVTATTASGRAATPGGKKAVMPAGVASVSDDSVCEQSAPSVASESNLDENDNFFNEIHTNIMQVEDMEPLGISAVTSKATKAKIPLSQEEDKKSHSDEASGHSSVVKNIFAGLQTVDDLLGREKSPRQQPDKIPLSQEEDKKSHSDEASGHSSVVKNIFAGLQTVDDLLGREKSPRQQPKNTQKKGIQLRDASSEDEISEALSEVTEASKKFGSKTAGGVYAKDSSESESESVSESRTSTRNVPDSHSSVTSDDDTKQGNLVHSKTSESDSRESRTKGSQSYSDDFHSRGTDSEVEDISRDNDERTWTESMTHSQSYTSYTESKTVTRSCSTLLKKRRKTKKKDELKDAAVQADGATLSTSHWLRDLDLSAVGSVTGIDPTPVAMHVINRQALEALTSYSPSILAMNEMLRSQLRHTQETIQASLQLHQTLVENIEMDYNYTTLEDTREYIRRHRRPKLTMKQALDEVRQEMEEGYR